MRVVIPVKLAAIIIGLLIGWWLTSAAYGNDLLIELRTAGDTAVVESVTPLVARCSLDYDMDGKAMRQAIDDFVGTASPSPEGGAESEGE